MERESKVNSLYAWSECDAVLEGWKVAQGKARKGEVRATKQCIERTSCGYRDAADERAAEKRKRQRDKAHEKRQAASSFKVSAFHPAAVQPPLCSGPMTASQVSPRYSYPPSNHRRNRCRRIRFEDHWAARRHASSRFGCSPTVGNLVPLVEKLVGSAKEAIGGTCVLVRAFA